MTKGQKMSRRKKYLTELGACDILNPGESRGLSSEAR
jgi:hypothetical protein